MKKAFVVLIWLTGGIAYAQNAGVEVKITGLRNNLGTVKIGLYNTEDTFLKAIYKSAVSAIKQGQATAQFSGLPAGTYAVSVFHDENDNGQLDKNSFGIPAEGYGTSNDAGGFMGPPKFGDAKFTITAQEKSHIKIHY